MKILGNHIELNKFIIANKIRNHIVLKEELYVANYIEWKIGLQHERLLSCKMFLTRILNKGINLGRK